MSLMGEKAKRDLNYYLPDSSSTRKLADFFFLFSDSNRLRLLSALSITTLCVNDIADVLHLNQTTVSHQLKLLRDMGIVKYKRQGKIIFYSLANKKINEVLLIGVDYLSS